MSFKQLSAFGEHRVYTFDTQKHDFLTYFRDLYGTDDLEHIHKDSEYYSRYALGQLHSLDDLETDLHRKFYTNIKTVDRFKNLYCRFISDIHEHFFPNEYCLLYQSFPSVRLQFPDSVTVPPHKDSDELGKHPLGEKNFIIPITKMCNTNTIHIESQPDHKDFQPVNLNYGQLFSFNGNTCTHYNLQNKEGTLRISLDFRIMLRDDYLKYVFGNITTTNPRDPEKGRVPTKMIVGGYYQLMTREQSLEQMMTWRNLKLEIMQSRPVFEQEETLAVTEYMKSDAFITEFQKTSELEQLFCEYIDCQYCIMTTSGTASLILALLALDIGNGAEVIVPDFTMIATVNAIKSIGAEVVLVDVDPETFTINLKTIKQHVTNRTRAVIHVSLNNRSACLPEIANYCKCHNLYLIEDAAQSLACTLKGQHYGTFGDIGCFSLSSPKIISTGQGGFCVTDNAKIAEKIRKLKNFGRAFGGTEEYQSFGLNFKYTDLQAVIGIEQIKKLPARVTRLREIYALYWENLHDICDMYKFQDDGWIPWFVDIYTEQRDQLANFLKLHNIQTRHVYPAVHTTPMYQQPGTDTFPNSTRISQTGLFLPTHFKLSNSDTQHVCDLIKLFLHSYRKNVLRESVSIVDADIGPGTVIKTPSNIYECTIGKDCFVGPFVEIQRGVTIGNDTRVSSHSFLCEGVSIGENCFIGHNVMFTNDKFKEAGRPTEYLKTIVGNNVRIGSGATILPVKIGDYAVIGAGSVVTKDVPEKTIVYGNPAKCC